MNALTPTERAALERLLASPRNGGEGWHRDSTDGLRVAAILRAGETRPDNEGLLEYAVGRSVDHGVRAGCRGSAVEPAAQSRPSRLPSLTQGEGA